MFHTWKNGSRLERWVTHEKMVHTWKNGEHFKKWVTLEKIGQTCKIGSHLEKWITFGKIGHSWKNGHTWKYKSFFESGSHLEKWVNNNNELCLHGHRGDRQHSKSILTISITTSKSKNNIKLSIINYLAFLYRKLRIVLTAC